MKNISVIVAILATVGCRKQSVTPAAAPVSVAVPVAVPSQIDPVVKDIPYQLSLKNGLFGFCDATGPQKIDLATGKQAPGTQTCDRAHEVVQNSCGEQVEIDGHPEGGNDHLAINDNEYVLKGQSGACDPSCNRG